MCQTCSWKRIVSVCLLAPTLTLGHEPRPARLSATAPAAPAVSLEAERDASELPSVAGSSMQFFPLEHGVEVERIVVQAGTNRVYEDVDGDAAGRGEADRLAYLNENGRFVIGLQANQLVADDLTLTARKECNLRRFTFQVSGRADPAGLGGPYRATYGLYNTCPQAGGTIIEGTLGQVDFFDDAMREVEVIVPGDVSLPRTTIWLGLRFNRENCGVIMGAPALAGFSGDVFDYPLLDCDGNLGGFPAFPHASFNARVNTDAACDDAYPGYRNIAPGEPGHNFGAGVRYADDLELGVQSCDLIGYEIGVKGQAAYSVDLRRDAGGFPGSVIEGTHVQVLSFGNDIRVFSHVIDPPIHLVGAPIRVWMSVRPNLATGKWIRTGRNAQVGTTTNAVAKETEAGSEIWEIVVPAPDEMTYGGYYAVLTCAGQPPLGACCDMYVPDENGEAVCRTVPEMNCPFPPRGTSLRPPWDEGSACRVCDGGCRDGVFCYSDADCGGAPDGSCVDGFCSEGCYPGASCQGDQDCAGADSGVCVDNDPFLIPCGKAACCTPQDECINLTRRECVGWPPDYRHGQWQPGFYCGVGTQRCLYSPCVDRTGDCTEPRDRICNGGFNDGATCANDSTCRGLCLAEHCIRGCHDGTPCTSSLQCNCDGVCTDADPYLPVCVGGARNGQFCNPDRGDRDCLESFCEVFPGCDDYDCCTNVCTYNPGPPLFTEFCCEVEWDSQCAELAHDYNLGLCPGLGVCPLGGVTWYVPRKGVVDAGRPHHPNDVTALQGIQTLLVHAPNGAPLDCWKMKETLQNTSLHPDYEPGLGVNDVVEMIPQESGIYLMVLRRPITPGERTVICYPGGKFGDPCGSFVAHPGDVNADGTTDMFDVAVLIDVLLGRTDAPWGLYSTDIDRDGSQTFLDLLELVDLLVGAGDYGVWWGSWIP